MLKKIKFIDINDKFAQIAFVICMAFIAQIFISYSFWEPANRQFPMVPIFESIPLSLGQTGNTILFWAFIMGLITTAFLDGKKYTILLLFGIYFIWVLQDVMRVQAWAYHYLLMLALIGYYQINKIYKREIIFLLQFIMVMTYFWTGFHKVNVHFAEVVFPWLMSIFPAFERWGDMSALGYATAIFELLLGLGLLWNRTRKITVLLILLFHSLILILLIADGWNYVVYPWNLVMMLLVYLLFWNTAVDRAFIPKTVYKLKLAYLVFFLYGIAPVLQPFNLWPYDLCQMMYTGLSTEMRFCFNEKALTSEKLGACVPKKVLRRIDPIGNQEWSLNMDDWAILSFNLPTYPADWYYRRIAQKLCSCMDKEDGFIELVKKTRWRRQDDLQKISCKVLLE